MLSKVIGIEAMPKTCDSPITVHRNTAYNPSESFLQKLTEGIDWPHFRTELSTAPLIAVTVHSSL
jgi:hypothetical protein